MSSQLSQNVAKSRAVSALLPNTMTVVLKGESKNKKGEMFVREKKCKVLFLTYFNASQRNVRLQQQKFY